MPAPLRGSGPGDGDSVDPVDPDLPLPPPTPTTTPTTPRPPLYPPDATVVLIGMRGVGKTTLGLIAATSLRRGFIDADAAFQTLHGPISAFVHAHGWAAFRDAETAILRQLLRQHPTGYVIACGGGVVEREDNRRMLARFRDAGPHPLVHVVRDRDETVRYLVDEHARPAWGEHIRHVWARRQPYWDALCTHTIASLPALPPSSSSSSSSTPLSPQFRMKHVETALVRLLRAIFGFASSHVPLAPGPRPPPLSGPSSGEYGGYGACESELGRGAKGPRTSFVALNFPDLRSVPAETILRVAGGVDVIEMRVDTLVEYERESDPSTSVSASSSLAPSPHHSPPGSGTATPTTAAGPGPRRRRRFPSLHHVTLCFGHLRRCSPLPILYTVRTEAQGGAFPDPYHTHPDLLPDYLALVELGFKLGAEYVDLELALPDPVLQRLLALRGAATQVVGADHDRRGEWDWNSDAVLAKYQRAARMGCDVIKLVSTPKTFASNLELLKFRAKVDALPPLSSVSPEEKDGLGEGPDAPTPAPAPAAARIPLLAINLGKGGQITRYLNPVLTPVTHPLLPGVAAPGQLTYAQTQQALFLSGLILEKTFFVPSAAVAEAFSREAAVLGLPYTFVVEHRLLTRRGLDLDSFSFGGAYLGHPPGQPLALAELERASPADEFLPPARATGWADLCVPACDAPPSYDLAPTPLGHYKHTNVRVLALAAVLTQNLSPINAVGTHTCALLVGLGRRERREVVEALRMVGARWVCLLACEGEDEDEDEGEGEGEREGEGEGTRTITLLEAEHEDGMVLDGPADGLGASNPLPSTGGEEGPGERRDPSRSTTPVAKPPLLPTNASASSTTTTTTTTTTATAETTTPAPRYPYPQHAPLTLIPLTSLSDPALYAKRAPTIIVSSDLPVGVGPDVAGEDRYGDRYGDGNAEEASDRSRRRRGPIRFPDRLFASPTGGAALDLSRTVGMDSAGRADFGAGGGPHPDGGGGLSAAIEQKRLRAATAATAAAAAVQVAGTKVNGGGPPTTTTRAVVEDGWQVLGMREVQAECDRQAFRALTGRRMG